MTDISSTTAKQDIPSMMIPEELAKKLVLEKRETWFPYGIMIADISLAIRAAVEAERKRCFEETRQACATIPHNYGDANDDRSVSICADIEKSIKELELEDIID